MKIDLIYFVRGFKSLYLFIYLFIYLYILRIYPHISFNYYIFNVFALKRARIVNPNVC